jgi:Cu-processing system permease protein
MRARETLLVAEREVKEAARSRWFVLAAVGFFALSMALSMVGLAGAERSGLAGFDRTTASLLNLVLLFTPLITLSLGGLGIAGELEDGSLGMLLSEPLSRGEVYLGKYLGLLLAFSAALAVGYGATGLWIGLARGGGNVRAFLSLVALTLALGAATLACGTLLSAAFPSRARVAGAAFSAWLVLVYLSDLGTIGLSIARDLSPGQVFALALLNPVEQARILGVISLSDRIDRLGPAGLYALDRFGAEGVILLLAAALVAAALAPLLGGFALFRKAVVP